MFSMADGGYLSEGNCLRLPDDPRVPKEYRGLLVSVGACTACDEAEAPPATWDTANLQKFENVMGITAGLERISHPDSSIVADPEGVLAAVEAAGVDLASLTYDVVYGPVGLAEGLAVFTSGRSAADAAIAAGDLKAFPTSMVFYLKSIPQCLRVQCQLVDLMSVPSCGGDLNPIINTCANLLSM